VTESLLTNGLLLQVICFQVT